MAVVCTSRGRYLDVIEDAYILDDIKIGVVQNYGEYRYMRDTLCLWESHGRLNSGERILVAKFKSNEFQKALKSVIGLQKLEEIVHLPDVGGLPVLVNYFSDGTGSGFSECVRPNKDMFYSSHGNYNQKGKEILFPN